MVSDELSRDELVSMVPLCLSRRLCAQPQHLPAGLPVAIATTTNLHAAPLGLALIKHLASYFITKEIDFKGCPILQLG